MTRRRGSSGAKQRERRFGFKRLVVPALLLLAGYYAVFGGEYSMFELRAARASAIAERESLVVPVALTAVHPAQPAPPVRRGSGEA